MRIKRYVVLTRYRLTEGYWRMMLWCRPEWAKAQLIDRTLMSKKGRGMMAGLVWWTANQKLLCPGCLPVFRKSHQCVKKNRRFSFFLHVFGGKQ